MLKKHIGMFPNQCEAADGLTCNRREQTGGLHGGLFASLQRFCHPCILLKHADRRNDHENSTEDNKQKNLQRLMTRGSSNPFDTRVSRKPR